MSKYVPRNFSMTPEVSQLINDLAKRTGMNKSELIRAAVRHFKKEVERNGK